MQIVVLGMHRSGTSTVSRILNLMGIYFGAEGSSTGANIENQKGFWERKDVRKLNDYILQENDFDWYRISNFWGAESFSNDSIDQFKKEAKKIILDMDAFRPWFIKEPRLCLNLPLWENLLEVPIGIFVYRNPLEVAMSLQHRNGFPLEFGLLLWEKYNQLALKASKKFPLYFVNYNELIESPKKVIDELSQFLKQENVPIRAINPKEIDGFIDKSMYRQRVVSGYKQSISKSQQVLYDDLLANKRSAVKIDASKESILLKYENIFRNNFQYNIIKKENEEFSKNVIKQQLEIVKKTEQISKLEEIKSGLNKRLEVHEQLLKQKDELVKVNNAKDELINKNNYTIKTLQEKLNEYKKTINVISEKLKSNEEKLHAKGDEILGNKIKALEYKHQIIKKDNLIIDIQNKLDNLISELATEKSISKELIDELKSELASEKYISNKLTDELRGLKKMRLELESVKSLYQRKLDENKKQTSIIDSLRKRNREKDERILIYWKQIQSMRLSSRLKRLFSMGFIGRKISVILNYIPIQWKEYKTKKIYQREIFRIKRFVKRTFNHKISKKTPLVSIIILNRDGFSHLKTLFQKWNKNTIYNNYEIIVFDNDSKDDSIKYLEDLKGINIKLIKNTYNASFSAANNIAAKQANGELILFLNNDVTPIYGWLNQLVKTYYAYEDEIGLVGAKLLYPYKEGEMSSLKVQHAGIAFNIEEGFVRPYNLDNNKNYFDLNHEDDIIRPSMTAACVLVSKSKFNEVNGFDEKYIYGFEDVDLGLKLAKLGYKNRLSKGSVLFHHEFGTQSVQPSKEVGARRAKNLEHFRNKWYKYLLSEQWKEMLNGETPHYFGERNVNVGIVVTEQGGHAVAGDFFTAKELANEFIKLNWTVKYFAQREGNFYSIDNDIDVLIVLLHGYDLSKIKSNNPNLIKIAWMRNWFEKFAENPGFDFFDLVFASSKKACKYILNEKGKYAHYLPIATNQTRFETKQELESKFECDYCFTGSYWNDPREIIDMLDPKSLPKYKFNLYGKNWEQVDKLQEYSRGFVEYEDMPKIYGNTKLLIDDANRVTKPWGSVNSRVFDAIMSGVLVITNGKLGSKDVFDNKLPYYETKDELNSLISEYLGNDSKRKNKIEELKKIVLENHTYKHRAESIRSLLATYYEKNMLIKMPVPNKESAHNWGDYHFAKSLKKEFERQKIRTRIQFLKDWEHPSSFSFNNVLVLRGLSKYIPRPFQNTMMWNISHPDKVSLEEYKSYNHVFIASKKWTEYLQSEGLNNVSTLLQCTDPEVFKIPKNSERVENELLFVGNSRGVYRKVIKDLLPTKYDLSIYGNGWNGLVDNIYIKGEHIDNKELYKYYGGAKILLNDHWDDMREKGFISNRIFDALACGATLITDEVDETDILKEEWVHIYKSKRELTKLIKNVILNEANDIKRKRIKRAFVLNNHTFAVRSKNILKLMKDA